VPISITNTYYVKLGDGEPDMDFPAIDKTMKLKAFNLNEFCLCTASDDAMPPPPPPPPLHILGPVANRPVSVRSMPQHVHGTSALNRKSPPPQMISESYVSEKSSHTPGMLSRQESFVVVSAQPSLS
jgi:SAPK-interacting protein 1 (Sin1), middle CRIM domain